MVANFYSDLSKARVAEKLICATFSDMTKDYTFTWVGDQHDYFCRGDVIATAKDGREIGIEVKMDGCIGQTRNVLCEYSVYYYETGEYGKGDMKKDCDIFTVVSYPTREIFVIDFKILKKIYTTGRRRRFQHDDQDTYCYLLPLSKVEASGALIATLSF